MTFSLFTSTCDADKARHLLRTLFIESLPAQRDEKRVSDDAAHLSDAQAVEWLQDVLCRGCFVTWRIDPDDDMYRMCLRG